MASPPNHSLASLPLGTPGTDQTPGSPQNRRYTYAYPVRTPSLATLAREIAHDPNFSQNVLTASPVHDPNFSQASPTVSITGRFTVETEHVELSQTNTEVSEAETDIEAEETAEDILRKVYHAYNTYDAYEGTDHNERVTFCPPFPAGVVRFTVKDEEDTKDRYYMIVNKDPVLDDVARFMGTAWRRRTPKLVLSVVGSSNYFEPWESKRFEEDFQDGIIQAANSTDMWILTEGLDIGVSKIIGDAAHREMTRRKNTAMNPLRIQNIHMTERLPYLNIFGVASKSSLVYADVLTGKVKLMKEKYRLVTLHFKGTQL